MKEQTLKISLYSCFVLLFGVLGFLVGVLLNAVSLYSDSNSSETYRFLIRTYLFAATSIPNYLLIATLFAVSGILVIYKWKREYAHTM
jgi:hypothetical protein